VTGLVKPKKPDSYQIVGQAATRLDMVNKVTGTPSYVHDMDLPGMVHGRVVRPPAYDATLIFVDENSVRQMPGVLKIIRDGSFLAVIAEREEQAIWASEALRASAVWENKTSLPTPETIYDHLLTQSALSRLIFSGTAVDDPIPPIEAPKGAASTLQAAYYRPYHMHGSLGPSAAIAQMVDGKLTIWSHTQGAFMLQASIANALKMDKADVRVIHAEGAGCYGHNGADDAGMDAALLARAFPGWPVSLKWMRADEHTWEPYGAAMVMKMHASLDDDGTVIDWNHDVWSYPHTTRPRPTDDGTSGLIAAWHLEQPFPKTKPRLMIRSHFGSYRNADPLYAFSKRRVVTHFVPDSPLRTSAMRSLGAYANVFAIESFMDELAVAAGADPVEFRLKHLEDPRAKAVIEAAAQKANWEKRPYPTNSGSGRGVAFAQYKNQQCYTAIIVDVSVDRQSGQIQLKNVIIAADSGQVVNPDGLSNQLEGGFVQAASWTLEEEVKFDQKGILSQDWDTYPILRFSNAPVIQTVIVNRSELPFLGSGEASQNPTPAAIANAVYDAVGIRLRQIPFTPERVLAALKEQGDSAKLPDAF